LNNRIKILVTGGAGYIGSHAVVELYEAGYQPIIVDNLSNSTTASLNGIKAILGVDIPFYELDCTDAQALKTVFESEEKVAAVIHFAALKAVGESVSDPLNYYSNNLNALLTVLRVMQEFGVDKLVFSSSATVYGLPENLPLTEESCALKPLSPYASTKKMCEDILRDLSNGKQKLSSICLRYFNPIGAHASAKIGELPLGIPNNLVPFLTQTAAGWREKLTVFGKDYDTTDGTCIRDYVHVIDLAKAHILAVRRLLDFSEPKSELFNIGTGKGSSVLELINTFEKVTGQKLNYEIGPRREGDVPQLYADVTLAAKELGYRNELSVEDGLRSAWNWQTQLQKYKPISA
jgi:UDP-glucose 4-epimerase